MITLPVVLCSLTLACVVVSVVYALISPGEPDRIRAEVLSNTAWMLGGILALGAGILIVGWVLG